MRRSRPRLLTRRPKHLRMGGCLVAHKFVSRESCLGDTSFGAKGSCRWCIPTSVSHWGPANKANAVCIDILQLANVLFWCKFTTLVWDSWTSRVNWTCVLVHLREWIYRHEQSNANLVEWPSGLSPQKRRNKSRFGSVELLRCSTIFPITHFRGWSSKLKTQRQEVHLDNTTLQVNSFQVERSPT